MPDQTQAQLPTYERTTRTTVVEDGKTTTTEVLERYVMPEGEAAKQFPNTEVFSNSMNFQTPQDALNRANEAYVQALYSGANAQLQAYGQAPQQQGQQVQAPSGVFMTNEQFAQFTSTVANIGMKIEAERRQKEMLEQLQPEKETFASKVAKRFERMKSAFDRFLEKSGLKVEQTEDTYQVSDENGRTADYQMAALRPEFMQGVSLGNGMVMFVPANFVSLQAINGQTPTQQEQAAADNVTANVVSNQKAFLDAMNKSGIMGANPYFQTVLATLQPEDQQAYVQETGISPDEVYVPGVSAEDFKKGASVEQASPESAPAPTPVEASFTQKESTKTADGVETVKESSFKLTNLNLEGSAHVGAVAAVKDLAQSAGLAMGKSEEKQENSFVQGLSAEDRASLDVARSQEAALEDMEVQAV